MVCGFLRSEAKSDGTLHSIMPPRIRVPGSVLLTQTIDHRSLMLLTDWPRVFRSADWVWELKYDGFRILAIREGSTARLLTRTGRDVSDVFPEITSAICLLRHDVVLDGELTVLDDDGRPDWHALNGRVHMTLSASIRSARRTRPALFFVFDLLAVDRHDLRPATLVCRQRALRDVVPDRPTVRCAEQWQDGIALLHAVTEHRLEGVVAKRTDSPYTSGRNRWWLKVRALTPREQSRR